MNVTVAICTWNRANLLDRTLSEMRHLRIPRGIQWELLVVNNACTDHTDQIIQKHSSHLPLRSLHEKQQGLSNARNCAVAGAKGDLLIWTDDDVLVSPQWIEEYLKAARNWPQAGFFGGTIEPWFEVSVPSWISQNLDLLQGPFVIHQLGNFVGPFPGDHVPYGANMAMRKNLFDRSSFDPNLGYCGASAIGGDETSLFAKWRDQGVLGVWVGPASVRHFIPKARMTSAYIRKWFHGFGQSVVRIEGAKPVASIAGAPRWAVRQYIVERASSVFSAPFSPRPWLTHLTKAARARGIISEYRAAARSLSANTRRPIQRQADSNLPVAPR